MNEEVISMTKERDYWHSKWMKINDELQEFDDARIKAEYERDNVHEDGGRTTSGIGWMLWCQQTEIERDNLAEINASIKADLKTALDWIADSEDAEGLALIVEPLRSKYNLSNNTMSGPVPPK